MLEFMESLNLGVIFLGLVVAGVVGSIAYVVLMGLINYVLRENYNIWKFEDWKQEKFGLNVFIQFVILSLGTVILLFVPLVGTSLHGKQEYYTDGVQGINILVAAVMPLLLLPLLRWLVDISRNLKIKKDTGDSARLKEMQDQIDKLSKAVKEEKL